MGVYHCRVHSIAVTEELAGRGAFDLKAQQVLMRQMEVMYGASIPLAKSIEFLRESQETPERELALSNVLTGLQKGDSLSYCLRRERIFPTGTTALIRLGEESGSLGDVFKMSATELEAQWKTAAKLKSSLTYPLWLGGLSILAVLGLVFFFLPRMVDFATGLGTELPPLVTLAFNILKTMTSPLVVFALLQAVVVAAGGLSVLLKREWFRVALDRFFYRSRLTKEVAVSYSTFQFCLALSTLLKCGSPLTTSLNLLQPAVSNRFFRERLRKANASIQEEGLTLNKALSESEVLPASAVQMIACGEESGRLDDILDVTSRFYHERFEERLETLAALVEPTVLLFLGGSVGGITILFFLPLIKVVSAL